MPPSEIETLGMPIAGHWFILRILQGKTRVDLAGCYVYIIWDDCSNRPVYVGSTAKGFRRILEHFKCKSKYGKSPAKYILEVARPWNGWTVTFLGPLGNDSVRTTENWVSRKLRPWHSSLPRRGGYLDIDGECQLPWYIREFLYRRELKSSVADVEANLRRQKFIADRLNGN